MLYDLHNLESVGKCTMKQGITWGGGGERERERDKKMGTLSPAF